MQLLGKSLEDIFNKLEKFSVKTTAMLGYQMLDVLQYIHDRHIIHRDIKPDNYVMGINDKNAILYLLDFGLAKKYRSSKTLIQYPYIKRKKLTGTARYASIHALEEMEQSRRDDLESTGYVLMYFLRGNLPWQGLKIKAKDNRYQKILDKKKETSSEELCKNFPNEFKQFMDYVKNLEYEENPDYNKLKRNFFFLITKKMEDKFDLVYDWTTQSDLKKRKTDDIITKIIEENSKNENEIVNSTSFEGSNNRSINDKNKEKKEKNKKAQKEKDDDDEDDDENNKIESKCCLM
jgi:serine/threonine protein kinase